MENEAGVPSVGWEQDAILVGADDVSEFNEDIVLPQSPEVIARIRKWLQPTSYDGSDSEYWKHLSSHLAGTGTWLLSSPTYQEWHSSPDMGILWILGVPGSGKSVIAATLADRLSQENVPVLYFFFRQIIDANHTPLSAIRDWLCQILAFSPPLQLKLLEYVTASRRLDSMSTADLWSLLRTAMTHLPKVYCVVDALDEMNQGPEMVTFLHSLVDLGAWRPSKVTLILTSRPVHRVEMHLRQAKLLNIRLDDSAVDVDIATYVQHQLSASSIPSKYHAAIKKAVPGRANGLFLYARLAMDGFLKPGAHPKQVLQDLPKNLNTMYTGLLREHAKRTRVPHQVQILILQWVTHATRPLRLLELAESINGTHFPEGQRDLRAAKDLARSACGPLVEVLPDETLSVVHHSLTEFLNGSKRTEQFEDYPILEYGPTHNYLALVCLAHLQSGCLDDAKFVNLHNGQRPELERDYVLPPFTKYATSNWYVHARKAEVAGIDQTEVNAAIDMLWRGDTFLKWQALTDVGYVNCTPFFAAVFLGLTSYTKALLMRPETDPNNSGMSMPPLHCAAEKGHADIVKLLLQYGADIQGTDGSGYRALHAAAANNQAQVIPLLLLAGADPFCGLGKPSENRSYEWFESVPEGTPISRACKNGHLEAMIALMPFIETFEQGHAALEEAVRYKRPAIVEVLLKLPQAMVDFAPEKHTLLYLAAQNRDSTTIKFLLDAGANPNLVYDGPIHTDSSAEPDVDAVNPTVFTDMALRRGYTALFAMSSGGDVGRGAGLWGYRHKVPFDGNDAESSFKAFKLFIDAGVNVNQVDNEGNTPLSYAFDIFAIRALLEAGADPTISNDAGDTVLHGHGDTIPQGLEMVQAILEQPNLDMKRRNDKGYTPLLSTLRHKNSPGNAVDKALMFLKFGTDASAVDNEGNSAFHLAAATKFASTKNENGREVKRELLGEHLIHVLRALGANPNTLNTAGDTPLHTINYRARDFSLDVFSALIEAGLDTESRDKQGRTPLFKAVNHSHNTYRCKNTFDAMVKAGCSFKTLDDRGRNLLFLVTVGDRSDLFPHLLKLGLDPKHVDHDGNTLWHVAVTCGLHTELRTGLIDLGVDPEQPNRHGQTPLHVISGRRTRPFDDANKDLKGPATFDKFLALLRDYDVADENRVTALHIASTFSEYQTKMLLQAGADWTKNRYTREGLTVFHLAARSRQANVVGVLVDFITSKGEKELIPISVNRRDVRGRSAMWYACASGRIETVQMLIDLEAMVEAETYEGSAWEGCVEFEREQQIWDSSTGSPEIWDHDYSSSHAGATLMGDRTRPTITQFGKGNAASKHRIDEIVTVLVGYEATARRLLPHAISAAAERGHAYIVDCFIRASELLSARKAANSPEYQLRLQKVLTSPTVVNCIENRRAARDEALRISDDTDHGLARLEKLLSLREYQLAGSILSEAACLTFDCRGESVLHTLVRHGHASILARVCNLDMANKLEDATWCEQQEVAANAPRGSIKPLLFSAILSDVPNMDVIRVLVLNIGVNVNAQTRHMKSTRQVPDVPYAYVKDEGVLHRILRSSTWWQEAQALPFFVSHCANLEMRDRLGRTPLHVALDRAPEVVYDIQTIKQLVSLGADVNALDDSGMSCLGRSFDDMATANFLIQHGARTCIPYKDLLRAIEQSNCAALELLLRQGDDPNCRDFEGEEWITPENPQRKPYLKPGAAYLLEQAACVNENQGYMDIDRPTREKMMSILVTHGANVNARYSDTTLMHRLIRSSKAVRVLLKYPSLDAHLVDPEGQTILHTACSVERTLKNSLYGEPSYVDMLLQQGADVFARDSKGRNALHFLFTGVERKIAIPDPRAVTAILARAPDLVAQVDDEGNTPLHKASWAAIDHVGELLDAGADPLVVNAKGDTPLHYLVCDTWYAAHGVTLEGARCENFRRILSLGANPNARNLHGETPIFSFLNSNSAVYFTPRWAVPKRMSYFSKDWEKALYDVFDDAGVDWHAVNGAGETLMHSAARVGNVELFRFLRGKGVDVGVEDHRQQTALDIAAAVGAGEILGMFERKVDG